MLSGSAFWSSGIKALTLEYVFVSTTPNRSLIAANVVSFVILTKSVCRCWCCGSLPLGNGSVIAFFGGGGRWGVVAPPTAAEAPGTRSQRPPSGPKPWPLTSSSGTHRPAGLDFRVNNSVSRHHDNVRATVFKWSAIDCISYFCSLIWTTPRLLSDKRSLENESIMNLFHWQNLIDYIDICFHSSGCTCFFMFHL